MRGPCRFKADAYDRLLSLPCSGWAWEFKRRDPALRFARRRAGAVIARAATRADGSTIYRLTQRCHVAEHFGLHFIPDPSLSAFDAAPFWLPETMSARFEAAIDAEMSGINGARRFHWTDLPGEKIFLVAPGRRDKLVIRATGYMAQIALNGDGALIPQSALFSLTLGADQLAAESLRHLKEFGRVCRGLATRRTPPRGASPQKLRDALIALDGALARLSRRQIAEAIYGAEVVKDDWENGIHSYKQRTKRLVDKGLALMTSGYRRLL
ncbi:DNA -binding domain-containing protein [Hyphococcus luteus]|nr:DUF2285 domain-containing protein [Marinicaulis flavus]